MKTITARLEKKMRDMASRQRIAAAHLETLAIVQRGECPQCGSGIRRNLSITGWFQCAQFGADGFRKDSTKPSCSWQGFTE